MNRRRPSSRWQVLSCCTALLGFALLVAACGDDEGDKPGEPGPNYEKVKEELRPLIELGMRQSQVRGLSIALVDDQQVVWSQGFGFADQEAQTPATAETVYEVGSVAKPFTATAVMQQVEQGRVGLDLPIQQLIPGFAIQSRFPQAGPVTARNLLTHHAGMPDQLTGAYAETPLSLAERIELLREDFLAYPPNEIWAYSNTGFVTLGRAVETASGQEFTAYMKQHLLAPLGMAHSSFRLEPHLAPRMAKGYGALPAEHVPPSWLDSEGPAGSLRSSVEDMSHFIQMLLAEGRFGGATLLQPGSLQEMWRQQNAGTPLDLDTRIGLTWYLYDLPLANGQTVRRVDHDGSTLYFQAMLALLPEHKLGVVVLANTDSAGPLVRDVARRTLAHALEAKSGLKLAELPREPQVRPINRPEEELRPLTGVYASDVGPLFVGLENGTLFTTIAGSRLELAPHEQGLFKAPVGDTHLWLSFDRIQGHDVLLAHTGSDGRQFLGDRITPYTVPEAWSARLGTYALPPGAPRELIEGAMLRMQDGLLILEAGGALFAESPLVLTLKPEGDDRAVVLGLGRGKGEVVRLEKEEGGDFLIVKGIRLQLQPSASPLVTEAGKRLHPSPFSRLLGRSQPR